MSIDQGMRGTIGPGGHGKSLSVAFRLYRRAQAGRRVIANTPCIDLRVRRVLTPYGWMWGPVNAETFGTSWAEAYITRLDQLPTLAECDVWLDEVWSWMAGHHWKENREDHEDVFAWMYQDRKDDVIVEWTHRVLDVDINIRRNTIELSRCSKWGPLVFHVVKDPQETGSKPRVRWYLINPATYDLYSTYQQIGDGRKRKRAAFGDEAARGSRRGGASSLRSAGRGAVSSLPGGAAGRGWFRNDSRDTITA